MHPNPDYDDDKAETSVVDMLHVEDSVFVLKVINNNNLNYKHSYLFNILWLERS